VPPLKPEPSTLTAASIAHCQLPMPAPQQAPEPARSALALLALKVPTDQQAEGAVRYSMPSALMWTSNMVSNGVGHRFISSLLCETQQLVTSTRNLCMYHHPPCNAHVPSDGGTTAALGRFLHAASSAPQVLARSAAALPAGCLLMAPTPLPMTCWQGPRSRGPVALQSQDRAWLRLGYVLSAVHRIPRMACCACRVSLGSIWLLRHGLAAGSMAALIGCRRMAQGRWTGCSPQQAA
jgi:hypothetical protein